VLSQAIVAGLSPQSPNGLGPSACDIRRKAPESERLMVRTSRARGTSGLSGLAGRRAGSSLVCSRVLCMADPGWLRASRADAHGGPRGKQEGGGGLNGPERPADTGRCRAGPLAWDAIDALIHRVAAGARGGHPTTAAPSCTGVRQLSKSAEKQRASGDRRAALTARGASGAVTSSWALRVRGRAADKTD
jgi:hypothetical protein